MPRTAQFLIFLAASFFMFSINAVAAPATKMYSFSYDGDQHQPEACGLAKTAPPKLINYSRLEGVPKYLGSQQTEFADKNKAGLDVWVHYFSSLDGLRKRAQEIGKALMPELPEVEVVRRELDALFQGQATIQEIKLYRKDLRFPIPVRKLKDFAGAQLIAVERRAKYLVFKTSKGDLLSHLGMSGYWRVESAPTTKLHDHIRIVLSTGEQMVYNDPRRFGLFEILDEQTTTKRFAHLGFEPFDENFTGESLRALLKGKKVFVKAALMDQEIVVGVGNIYVCEVLFRSGISPLRKAHRVKLAELEALIVAMRTVLARSIEIGGSSISDFKSTKSEDGGFQNEHQVYDRKGKPCLVCGTAIRHRVSNGRSTYWCVKCQK